VLNITLPKVQTAGKNELTGKVEIAVDKDGKLSLNGKLIAQSDLEKLLTEVKQMNKDTPILIRADEISQFGKVTQVMDVCRKLGLNKLVIETRK
jgi:biopolymer transport protein ExbD